MDQRIRSFLTTTIINLLKEVPLIEARKTLDFMDQSLRKNTSSGANANSQMNQSSSNNSTNNNNATSNLGANLPSTKGELSDLIGVGLIGAMNTTGFSNASALASSIFSTGCLLEESNFNKRLLSRFACYLIYSLIKPSENGDIVILKF